MAKKWGDDPKQIDFAQLLKALNNSGIQNQNNALYQVIYQLLSNAQKNKDLTVSEFNTLTELIDSLSDIVINNVNGLVNLTYITTGFEHSTLPNSRQLLPGSGISFDDSQVGKRTVNSSGGSGSNGSALGLTGVDGRDGEDSYIPGPAGLQGAIGPTGNPGVNGVGIPGEDGKDGEDSFIPGPPGLQGAIGNTGSPGVNGIGIPGEDGRDGEDSFIPGPIGIQGAIGLTGNPGINGVNGIDGIDGQDGIDSIIPGPVGPMGPQGIQGNPGLVGYNGIDGIDGQDGLDSIIPGPAGPTGNPGSPGSIGTNGYNGLDGLDGQDGIDALIPGPAGANGIAGINGLDGSQPEELLALIGRALKRVWFLEQALEVDYRTNELSGPGVPTEAELVALEEIDLLEDVVNVTYNQRLRTFGITIDGVGSVITTGTKGEIQVPYSGTIIGWTLLATDGLTGSIVVDVYRDSYNNFPPTVADTITGSSKPTISSSNKGTGTALGWLTNINAGDVFGFNVDSISTFTRVTLTVTVLVF